MRPHRVEVRAEGWAVEGVREDGAPEGQLQFTRLRTGAELPDLEPGALPGFARVDRLLHLGLDWRVDTEVRRLSPLGQALVLEVPLLAGESVTTEGVRVRDGKVLVSLAADADRAPGGRSVIADKRPELTLVAPKTLAWTERWRADVSPIWHLDTRGLPVVHHQDPNGRWLPEWRPWPGEALTLVVSRPAAIEGPTLTLKASRLATEIGQRATDSTLVLALESSQGGQHALTLPEDGRLLQVLIDGQAQPIRQEGRQIGFPLTPGERSIEVRFRQDRGITPLFRTPELDLGAPSANHSLEARLGSDRWVLFVGGPRLGPAVLFWGALAIVALLALGLGRTRYTPLAFRHWFLLGIGLSQGSAVGALLVAAWLLALGARTRVPSDLAPLRFDALQIALVLLTLLAARRTLRRRAPGPLGSPRDADRRQWLDRLRPLLVPGPQRCLAPARVRPIRAFVGLSLPDAGLGAMARLRPPPLAALGLGLLHHRRPMETPQTPDRRPTRRSRRGPQHRGPGVLSRPRSRDLKKISTLPVAQFRRSASIALHP